MRDLAIDDSLLQPKAVLGRISHAKNLMQGPEAFSGSYNPHDAQLGKIFDALPAGARRQPTRSTSTTCC